MKTGRVKMFQPVFSLSRNSREMKSFCADFTSYDSDLIRLQKHAEIFPKVLFIVFKYQNKPLRPYTTKLLISMRKVSTVLPLLLLLLFKLAKKSPKTCKS